MSSASSSLYTDIAVAATVYNDGTKTTSRFALNFTGSLDQNLEVESSAVVKIPPSTVDVPFSFQSVAAGQLVMLSCASPFQVKFGVNTNTPLLISPKLNSKNVYVPAFLILLGDSITEIFLSNPTPASPPGNSQASPLTPFAAIDIYVGVAGVSA